MSEYNERWTREKFIEYRKLKRSGYSHKMLKEHFGEDIYHSGLYNKNGKSLPIILKFCKYINEIKITPEKVDYSFIKQPSNLIRGKSDFIISFFSNGIPYIISLVYFPIDNRDTFNVIFTTRNQWNDYEYNLINFLKKGSLTNNEFEKLENIIGEETKFNDLFPIFRKLSWILLDFYDKHLKGEILSIGDTANKKKINLYRNIIKDSFANFVETETISSGYKYFLYEIL
jgi:hypothetical protein